MSILNYLLLAVGSSEYGRDILCLLRRCTQGGVVLGRPVGFIQERVDVPSVSRSVAGKGLTEGRT